MWPAPLPTSLTSGRREVFGYHNYTDRRGIAHWVIAHVCMAVFMLLCLLCYIPID